MRYFYDTEFIENGHTIELISLGVVSDDGRDLYLVNADCDLRRANDWTKENVLSQLPPKTDRGAWRWADQRKGSACDQIARALTDFVRRDPPELWGYMCAFDHVILSQLFKGFQNWPAGWPYFSHDVAQIASGLGVKHLPNTNPHVHHALHDARWARDTFYWLQTVGKCEFCAGPMFNGKCVKDGDFEDDELAQIAKLYPLAAEPIGVPFGVLTDREVVDLVACRDRRCRQPLGSPCVRYYFDRERLPGRPHHCRRVRANSVAAIRASRSARDVVQT